MLIRTIVISKVVGNRTHATVKHTVFGCQHRLDKCAAAVGHHWRYRGCRIGNALNFDHTVRWQSEHRRFHHIRIFPSISCSIDNIMIMIDCRITRHGSRMDRIVKHFHCVTAHRKYRSLRNNHVTQASHIFQAIVHWCEQARNQGISIGPNRVMMCTIGIFIMEGYRSCTIYMQICHTIHKHRNDSSATNIRDIRSRRTNHIHQTRFRSPIIRRHSGYHIRQYNMVSKLPSMSMSRTICVRIAEYQVAAATVVSRAVNADHSRTQSIETSILHLGQCNTRSIGMSQTFHCAILEWRHRKVFR